MAEFSAEFGIIPYWLIAVLQSRGMASEFNVGRLY